MTRNSKSVVINSPYSEPAKHISYRMQDSEREAGFVVEDGRRPSGFWIESGNKEAREFVELELVNRIRRRVKAWRENDYPEVTGITRELLCHWHDRTARPNTPFFFCQLEAIETLIFLAETREGKMTLIPGDGGAFQRVCTKLCTGGGKTVVMSMLISWQACNAVTYPRLDGFTKNFLIIAPNLTVKDRLGVLKPQSVRKVKPDAEKQREIREAKKRVAGVEREIAESEARIAEMDSALCEPETLKDSAKVQCLMIERNNLDSNLKELYSQWEEETLRLENLKE